MIVRTVIFAATLVMAVAPLAAQDRDTKVRNDRSLFEGNESWVYDDLETGLAIAKNEDRPVLIVFR